MQVEYTIGISCDLARTVEPVRDLVERLNNAMAICGSSESFTINAEVMALSMQVNRELTKEEQAIVKELLNQELQTRFTEYGLRVSSFRRKSCSKSSS